MKWAITFSFLILAVSAAGTLALQARGMERMGRSGPNSFDIDREDSAPALPLVQPTVGTRPGIGRPVITPMLPPTTPNLPAVTPTAPRPKSPPPASRPGDGELLPGMLDPKAPAADSSQNSPVWKPFLRRFNQCAPGCRPIRYNSWRYGDPLCHGSGRAIDVFGMRCSDGKVYMAENSSRDKGAFAELVKCMAGPKPKGRSLRLKKGDDGRVLGALWHNGHSMTDGHRNHAHFSIGCGGGMW